MRQKASSNERLDSAEREQPLCPTCDRPASTTLEDETYTYGSGEGAVELNVRLPVRHCEACDFHFIDQVGERIRTEAVYLHHGLLTPWEIRAIRENRRLSRAAFAEITGLGEATIKRWETGAITQNRANDRYLRLLNDDTCWSALKRLVAPKSEPPPARAASTHRSRSTTSAPPAAAASP